MQEEEVESDGEVYVKGSADPSAPLSQVCSEVGDFAPIIEDNPCFLHIDSNDVDRLKSNYKDGFRNNQIVVKDEDENLELKVFDHFSLPTRMPPVSMKVAADHSDVCDGVFVNPVCLDGDKDMQFEEYAHKVLDGLPHPADFPSAAAPSSWANVVANNVNANIHAPKVLEFIPHLNSEVNLPLGGAKSDPGAVKLGDDLYTGPLEGDRKEQVSDYGILNVHEGLTEVALRELNDRPHAKAIPTRTWANVVDGMRAIQNPTGGCKLPEDENGIALQQNF
ncbi:hypothetical protein U1Q18_009930 [Sarracenia purpurea var. burkii]